MAAEYIDPKTTLPEPEPGPTPVQPSAKTPMKRSLPLIFGLGAIILIFGLANIFHVSSNTGKNAPKSSLTMQPTAPNAQQVGSFENRQLSQAQHDEQDRLRQQQLAMERAELENEQGVPGPESDSAAPMTPAQRAAIYGSSPNAPQRTSNVSQAQAEAKERELAREKQRQDALNSDTVAIDFSGSSSSAGKSSAAPTAATSTPATDVLGERQQGPTQANGEDLTPAQPGKESSPARMQNVFAAGPASQGDPKNPMAPYDFDGYQGRLYRVFEGTVLEGVVTNHIDGALSGPILVMLTTDYYSHDHQQLLLPQGTRLIGQVRSVGSVGQRKLFVVFTRAVCPDGFSLDLNRFLALDQTGTTGLATNVNNHYLSSFAAAAAIGGIGGLAQINNGNVLDASAELRNGITQQTGQEGEQILQRFLSRLPIITVKEGSRARVYINQDMLIPSYAEHRVDPNL